MQLKQWLIINHFMLMRNFDKIAIKLTRVRTFLKKHIAKMSFIFINLKAL